MTTHDVHRTLEENLFGTAFHRHNPLQSGATLRQAAPPPPPPPFRSMTPSEIATLLPARSRPNSDIYHQGLASGSAEAEAIDRWFENIQRYEQMLEEVAAASLDQEFKDELDHVNEWFRCRSDAERTAALYSVVQNASQIQIRFLITVLQQLANQDPLDELLSPAGQDKATRNPPPVTVAGSVVSTESQYELRKRHMYPPSRRATRSNLYNRISSTLSEPDDLRRRSNTIMSRPLNLAHQQGLLYQKALELRAQVQAANTTRTASSTTTPTSNTTTTTTTSPSTASSTVGYPPRLKPSCSTSAESTTTSSLFGTTTDWPFPLVRGQHTTEKPLLGRIGDRGDDNWSSFSSKKSSSSWARSTTIKEEEHEGHDAISKSLLALEQARAKLSQEKKKVINTTPERLPPPPTIVTTTTITTPPPPQPPSPPAKEQQQQQQQYLTPYDQQEATDYFSDQSDASNQQTNKDEQQQQKLTGAARRRKRSSAARALKDKLAAERVDFELMKDVQSWLRSLRLHKYGHAFEGMQWQQVVRMTDEDMLKAGVSTVGARRKLLKVFENVMRYCEENGVQY